MQDIKEETNTRPNRYQAAIIEDGKILLIMHRHHVDGREYWIIPGGGQEEGETEEECVAREAWEETGLVVRVQGLILEFSHPGLKVYQKLKTYLCAKIDGIEKPGYEPEAYAAAIYAIVAVSWVDLRNENDWGELIRRDPFTYPQLLALQKYWNDRHEV